MPLILQLGEAYEQAKTDPEFLRELAYFQRDYVGRPSPLYYAERLSEHLGGAKIYLKREELNHTGAHKINNCIGQILLARRMGKKRIIAETGAGMHGVATATVAARFGLECVVYMGTTDIERQQANVFRMNLLGAKVIPVTAGTGTLKDAHSISAGLDYPGVGPEHSWLRDVGRVEYTAVSDDEALAAFQLLCRQEGIIPALESSHALAEAVKRAPQLPRDHLMVVNLSGRGDKDMASIMHYLGEKGAQS